MSERWTRHPNQILKNVITQVRIRHANLSTQSERTKSIQVLELLLSLQQVRKWLLHYSSITHQTVQ